MARAQPPKPTPARKASAPQPTTRPVRRVVGRLLLHVGTAGALIYGLWYATIASRGYLEDQYSATEPTPLTIELVDKPAWMSDYLARQIAATVPRRSASPFDHNLLVDAVDRLRANPWVREVRQVRRSYGEGPGDTLVVDCDYRVPIALVKWGLYYWLVDNDGFKLPDQFTEAELPQVTGGRDGHTELRVVTGVRQPPPENGQRWAGGDLSAALDMAKLIHGKGFLDSVTGINVANFGGRMGRAEPQVVLDTKDHTQVWWGRPPLSDDFYVEVPVAKKLATLQAVVQQFGRVDAGKAWLDVRFDTGLLPADPPTAAPDKVSTVH